MEFEEDGRARERLVDRSGVGEELHRERLIIFRPGGRGGCGGAGQDGAAGCDGVAPVEAVELAHLEDAPVVVELLSGHDGGAGAAADASC